MELSKETIYELLANDESKGLASTIDKVLTTNVHSKEDWIELVGFLQRACQDTYQKHWLKTHHMVLSIFGVSELLGIDSPLFDELRSLDVPKDMTHASNSLFELLIDVAKTQFNSGGSTLFFDVDRISSTRSAVITSDLIQARYRETIFVIQEIDDALPSLTKEWVDASRLWRTGNGFRLLRAKYLGIPIHIKDYKEIRAVLLNEMKVKPDEVEKESNRLRKEGYSDYLNLSKSLDEFVTGLIASSGIRGSFDPYYRTWIDHEGLDEF